MRKRVLLLVLGLLVGLLLAEISMIVFEPFLPSGGSFVYDRELGFRVRSGWMGANKHGFRDVDYPLKKTDGGTRIVFLGDSFNWAGEFNYVDVVRHLVGARPGAGKIDIMNAGYPMTHTGEQLEVLKRYVLQYEPDLVVLGFFAGNDFIDGDRHRKRIVLNDCFYDVDRREETFVFGFPIVPRSRLWTFLAQKLRIASSIEQVSRLSAPAGGSSEAALPKSEWGFGATGKPTPGTDWEDALRAAARLCPADPERVSMNADAYVQLVANKMEFCSRSAADNGMFRDNIRFILAAIDEMAELLKERGVQFVVGVFPDEYQVSQELVNAVLARKGRTVDDYELLRQQRILKNHLERRGIQCLDLHHILETAQPIRPAYTSRDTHWNLFGNYVVGHAYYHLLIRAWLDERARKK